MGGPLAAWEWSPAASTSISRIEVYTGEEAGATSRLALWSDDGGAPSRPLGPLGWSDPFMTEEPKAWYGADLVAPVPVTVGTAYWIVWDSQGGEQVSLALKAPQALGVLDDLRGQHLDRHVAVEVGVGRPVHLTHPAGPEGSRHAVVGESLAD